jgi:hypothetical protein
LLATFFRLVATAVYAGAELFYFAPLPILGGADYLKTFSPDQLNSLALLSLRLYGYGGGIFLAFYGIASVLLGYLIFRSGYLPKVLGGLMALSGLGFVASNLAVVLAPTYASSALLLPTAVAGFALPGWLLVKGVDVERWDEKATSAGFRTVPS